MKDILEYFQYIEVFKDFKKKYHFYVFRSVKLPVPRASLVLKDNVTKVGYINKDKFIFSVSEINWKILFKLHWHLYLNIENKRF